MRRSLELLRMLRILILLITVVVVGATDSFDQTVGGSHIHGGAWARPGYGKTEGSYYHYHVPVVGQGWGWAQEGHGHSMGKHNHAIWALALILGIALLSLLLLPLLLIPLGLSLLALLGGGMMMMMMMGMMMMMMMMPQGLSPLSKTELVGRAVDTVGKFVMGDAFGSISELVRSIDMQNCPEKAACTLGEAIAQTNFKFFPDFKTSKDLQGHKHLVYKFIKKFAPKGTLKVLRQYEKAFWTGVTNQNCSVLDCTERNQSFKVPIRPQNSTSSETDNVSPVQFVEDGYLLNYSGGESETSLKNVYVVDPYEELKNAEWKAQQQIMPNLAQHE